MPKLNRWCDRLSKGSILLFTLWTQNWLIPNSPFIRQFFTQPALEVLYQGSIDRNTKENNKTHLYLRFIVKIWQIRLLFIKTCLFIISWSKRNGILLPKLLWPTVRTNCSSDQEKTFEIRGWRPRIQTVKGLNNFW